MKVTLVSIKPTEAAEAAGRPALTPELTAATAARYSRNNEGLDAILSLIDPSNLDRSVDSIFNMIDYGHQSIGDMADVNIFIDDLSMWLVYYIWSISPTASGQESSTRYIRINPDSVPSGSSLGVAPDDFDSWQSQLTNLFDAYTQALTLWQTLSDNDPALAKIPKALLNDTSPKSQRTVARMLRNYAFDRARYFLPFATCTNVMLKMNARNWAQLIQQLLSHPLPEPNELGRRLRQELALVTPRMQKHAAAVETTRTGLRDEFDALCRETKSDSNSFLSMERIPEQIYAHPATPHLQTLQVPGLPKSEYASALRHHENRYSWIGPHFRRIAVRFGWDAVALAEVRDLNRHRTGNKYCPLKPVGFYCAQDQVPESAPHVQAALRELAEVGRAASRRARGHLIAGNHSYVYFLTLGTQVPFEHLTTANHFAYETQLRTGTGAHYRYADHFRDLLPLWFDEFPETRQLLKIGTAEPE